MNMLLIRLSTYVDKYVYKVIYIHKYVDTCVNKWIIYKSIENIDFIRKMRYFHIDFTT